MHINNVKVIIKADTPEGIQDFGFSYDFAIGLNILTGDNSSGKSTVLSCINYCLGLEQLIGSKGSNALSPALHQALSYKGCSYNIYDSKCSLGFTANNGKYYILTRQIKLSDEDSFNEVEIQDGSVLFSKFIHSERDHQEQGFYRWLAEVNELEIIEVESFNGGATKPLYMQNIFTLSFIEQTKGWSDLFSMMPSFGIKDPKQKVVEYCLDLNSLKINMELDYIKNEKTLVKSEWIRLVNELNFRAQSLQIYISDYNRKTPISEKKIKGLYAAEISEDSKEIKIDAILNKIDLKIKESDNKVKNIERNNIKSDDLLEKKDLINESLTKYSDEQKEMSFLFDEEKLKLSNYKKALSDINSDLQGFRDVEKISIDRKWDKISTAQCPVCDSNIENKKDKGLSADTIEKTIVFLKSQKSTYEKYIESSEQVIGRYDSVLSYYKKNIRLKKEQLNSIYADIKSPTFISIRSEFELQAELKHRKNELISFNEFFSGTKERFVEQSLNYFRLIEEEKRLRGVVSSDDEKINSFRLKFKGLLKLFGYKSNGVENITIKNDAPNRLLPTVFIKGQQAQYIRFVSSASDFVRSIWAYYFSLLINGNKHPGFLIMDEPGQHQMRVDSMKELLKLSSELDNQVILAISQDREYDNKKVNISDLVEGIDDKKYNLLHIVDGAGCIVKMTSELQEK